jgi:hypothetical protein
MLGALEQAVDRRVISLTLFKWLKIYLVGATAQTLYREHVQS